MKIDVSQKLSPANKRSIVLFGGAFDPPTLAHLAVAKFVLNSNYGIDQVWFTPCYRHRYNKNMAPCEDRLAMCQLMLDDNRIKVFDYEIKNRLRDGTYDFIKRLLEEQQFIQDKYNLSLLIGMDNANTFDRWVNSEELKKLIRFIVVPRASESPNPKVDWYLKPPHIFLQSDKQLPHISSTDVRKFTFRRYVGTPSCEADVLRMINPNVWEYIQSHGLYQNQ